jgi:hypothetical protein
MPAVNNDDDTTHLHPFNSLGNGWRERERERERKLSLLETAPFCALQALDAAAK